MEDEQIGVHSFEVPKIIFLKYLCLKEFIFVKN
jgi:hypothetical protein